MLVTFLVGEELRVNSEAGSVSVHREADWRSSGTVETCIYSSCQTMVGDFCRCELVVKNLTGVSGLGRFLQAVELLLLEKL